MTDSNDGWQTRGERWCVEKLTGWIIVPSHDAYYVDFLLCQAIVEQSKGYLLQNTLKRDRVRENVVQVSSKRRWEVGANDCLKEPIAVKEDWGCPVRRHWQGVVDTRLLVFTAGWRHEDWCAGGDLQGSLCAQLGTITSGFKVSL